MFLSLQKGARVVTTGKTREGITGRTRLGTGSIEIIKTGGPVPIIIKATPSLYIKNNTKEMTVFDEL